MSRPQETRGERVRTRCYVVNFTIESPYALHSIVDSLKGIENININAKEIGPHLYDFIISFGTNDDKIFHEKIEELQQICMEDFPKSHTKKFSKLRESY